MNKFQEMYRAKLKTAEEVAMYVKSGDICACPTGLEEPETICAAVGERARRGEITGVQHHAILSVKGNAFMHSRVNMIMYPGLQAAQAEREFSRATIPMYRITTAQHPATGETACPDWMYSMLRFPRWTSMAISPAAWPGQRWLR